MKLPAFASLLIVIFCFVSCQPGHSPLSSLTLPSVPVPMTAINSTADDYNSNLPIVGLLDGPIVFSSKRNGDNFDIIYKNLDFNIDIYTGRIRLAEETNGNLDAVISNAPIGGACTIIKTKADELGPLLIPYPSVFIENQGWYNRFMMLYSSGEAGNQDIRIIHNRVGQQWSTPQDIKFLNSAFDDAYPTFLPDTSALYFCSNRAGNFDIYKAALSPEVSLLDNLSDTVRTHAIEMDNMLSSPFDDKCPMIYNNVLVFTSNRPGGFGGFDLYYSLRVNGAWSAPVNFGPDINSMADEYRPTIKQIFQTTNDLMVFSSNREGGKGGFDLYYVGIPKVIEATQ